MLGILPSTWGPCSIFCRDPWGVPRFLCHWLSESREAYHGLPGARHWILKHERFTQAQDWTPQICVSRISANYVLTHQDLTKWPLEERDPAALPQPSLLIFWKEKALLHTEKVLQGLQNTVRSLTWCKSNQGISIPTRTQFLCTCIWNPRGHLLRKCPLTDL